MSAVKMPPDVRDYFVKMGRKGGKRAAGKGGKARAKNLTKEQRSEAARKAVQARWAKARKKDKAE